jgi:dihydroorotase
MNPPLREEHDCDALWSALRERRICAIGTDHAPHTLEEKARGTLHAPSGVPGLDTALRLLLRGVSEGRLDWSTLVYVFSTGPATAFNLSDRGHIQEGLQADLVLIRDAPPQPLAAEELHTRCGWSPFEGWSLPPAPHRVWVSGRLVAHDGRIVDDDVRGEEAQINHG